MGRGLAVDATQAASCRAALKGHGVAVHCAGPFNRLDGSLLDACLDEGCHYADITDDRGYAALVRRYDERFRGRGLTAVYGCSSLPGISGVLALHAREGTAKPVDRVRVTLFIGNNNPKGEAAVRSLLAGLGRPITAPQGVLRGFRDREVVPLPAPFGRRGVFNFDAPEYDLFPALLGARAVSVKVGFELRPATYAFALLALFARTTGAYGPSARRAGPAAAAPWLLGRGGPVGTSSDGRIGPARGARGPAPRPADGRPAVRPDGPRPEQGPCHLTGCRHRLRVPRGRAASGRPGRRRI